MTKAIWKRTAACAVLSAVLTAAIASAQISGNVSYANQGGKSRIQTQLRDQRTLSKEELPPDNSMFIDASVLMNIKADEYVAVFAVSQEGNSVAEADAKMNETIGKFMTGLRLLHVRDNDVFVDYIAEPKVYGYDVSSNIAREKLVGFELKKNVSIHYSERDLLDKILETAAGAEIYDLVKVDYVLKDISAVHAKLMAEASSVIQEKLARDEKLLGVKVKSSPAIYAEKPGVFYPSELYDSYTAVESEPLQRPADLQRLAVQSVRKSRSFFFNPLDANGFDKVINPVVLEPVVQCTLYLKLKYDVIH